MKRLHLAVIATFIPPLGLAQPIDKDMMALGGYYSCIGEYARRFAGTKELITDIASAALVACTSRRNEATAVPPGADRAALAAASESFKNTIEENGRRLAAKEILEARYPVKK